MTQHTDNFFYCNYRISSKLDIHDCADPETIRRYFSLTIITIIAVSAFSLIFYLSTLILIVDLYGYTRTTQYIDNTFGPIFRSINNSLAEYTSVYSNQNLHISNRSVISDRPPSYYSLQHNVWIIIFQFFLLKL